MAADSPDFEVSDHVLLHDRSAEVVRLESLENGNWKVGVVTSDDKRYHSVIWPITELERLSSPLERAQNLDFDPSWKYNALVDALRFKNAYLYDPLFSLSTTRIDALPHQIEAVYDRILPAYTQSFLIADDTGLGKTVMAGMTIKELKARGRANRVLVICPSPLTYQWVREMRQLFELEFIRYDGPFLRSLSSSIGPGANPWDRHHHIVTSIDLVRREEVKFGLLAAQPWDLLIIDEAHKCKAYQYGDKIEKTARYQIAEALTDMDHSENLLLLTATPHDGKPFPFYALLTLVDPYIAPDAESLDSDRVGRVMIRRLKEDIIDWDGKPLFKPRKVQTIPLSFDDEERLFYQQLTDYVTYHFNRAKQDERMRAVGFAMTLLQKRMVSSIHAIRRSLLNRAARLEERLADRARAAEELGEIEREIEEYESEYEDLEDQRREELEERILSVSVGEAGEIQKEIVQLQELAEKARPLVVDVEESAEDEEVFIPDSKAQRLLEFVRALFEGNSEEKLLVFTEYVDTLQYIVKLLARESEEGRTYSVTIIHGSMDMESRQRAEEEFRTSAQILVATDAAGEGLNLQFAHIMVNYELPWNPTRLEQRMGRLHRYGQVDVVHIHNLLVDNTREGQIFARLLEKIEKQKEMMGDRVFDVLGTLLQDVNLPQLVMEVLSSDDPTEIERVVRDKLDRPIEERNRTLLDFIEKRALVRQQINLAPQLAKMRRSQESAIGPEDLERFLGLILPKLTGGRINKRKDGLFTVDIPLLLVDRELVYPTYKDVTFDRGEAKRRGRGKATFLALGHPAIDRIVDYVLSPKWGGHVSVKLDPEGRLGIILNYRVSVTDGEEKPVSERIFSYFSTPEENVSVVSPAWHWDLMDHPGSFDTQEEEVFAVLGGQLQSIENRTRSRVISDSTKFRDKLADRRKHDVQIKKVDAEGYFEEKLKKLKRRLREQKAQAHIRDMTLAIRNTERTVERRKFELESRMQALERERVLVFEEPELDSLCVVLPHLKGGISLVDAEVRKRVEQGAMEVALAFERENGRVPRDVSLEFLGYDIRSEEDDEERYIEVKGFKTSGAVELTLNEWQMAGRLGDSYWLYIVENACDEPKLYLARNPSARYEDVRSRIKEVRFRIEHWKEGAELADEGG